MTRPSRPLPGAVTEALNELTILTECYCEPAWSERGLHGPDCRYDWREDVEVLRDALAASDTERQFGDTPTSANGGAE